MCIGEMWSCRGRWRKGVAHRGLGREEMEKERKETDTKRRRAWRHSFSHSTSIFFGTFYMLGSGREELAQGHHEAGMLSLSRSYLAPCVAHLGMQ